MTSGSLRLRLVAGGAFAIVAALALAGAGLTYLFERHLVRSLAEDLEIDLRQGLAAVGLDAAGRPQLAREPTDPRFAVPLSGHYWQVASGSAAVRSRSLWDATLPMPADVLAPGELHRHRIEGPGQSELLAVERTVLLTGSQAAVPVRIVVAADLAHVAAARRDFAADLVPGLALLALVLAGATWVQTGLGLKPLAGLGLAIAAVRRGERARIEGAVPNEVAPLVEEINNLLSAQEKAIERSRRRAADLAHGLKTPLSALAADARELDERGDHALARRISETGEAMRAHVERELARARIRGASSGGTVAVAALHPLVESLISLHRRTSEGARLSFENAVALPAQVGMDRADLAEVLGNLIENAARNARARVRIGVRGDGRILVEDDGPGIPEGMTAAVLARGERLDRMPGGGTGLGLAIVQDVLEAYGRELELGTSELGGVIASF